MARVVILPTPAHYYQLDFWLDNFCKNCIDEVDRLVVVINSNTKKHLLNKLIRKHDNEKIQYKIFEKLIDHGNAIDEGLNEADENDEICLLEDDLFITRKGELLKNFDLLKRFDVVASPRGSCCDEITQRSIRKYKLKQKKEGDIGVNFWPCMLFSKAKYLLETDRNFKAKMWCKGEVLKELELVLKEDCYGDTFVNTSIQLRAKGLRFFEIPQYHLNNMDADNYSRKKYAFSKKAGYFHVGSLSGGVEGLIAGSCTWNTEQERKELARRYYFFKLFYSASHNQSLRGLQDLQTCKQNLKISDQAEFTNLRMYKKLLKLYD